MPVKTTACYVCEELRQKIQDARTADRDDAAEWWGDALGLHLDTDEHPAQT